MSDTGLRVRSASEIVDAGFALYRRNLLQYVMVTAIAYLPSILFNLYLTTIPTPVTPEELLRFLPAALVSILSFSLVGAMNSRMGSDVYLGNDADVGRTLREVVQRFPALLMVVLVTSIMSGFALLLFILPLIWVVAITFAAIPVVVLEKKGPFAAIARSSGLSKGRKGHILGTLLLVWAIYLVLSFGISLSAQLFGSKILGLMFSSAYAIFAYPIVNLATMVLYYDARIRAEGFDVEHMAQSLPAEPAFAPVGNG